LPQPPPPAQYINIYAQDITAVKQAEKGLRELNATLEDRVTQRTRALESRTEQLQKMALELSQAEERERKRMAEILHDDLQQILAGAKFHLSLMRSRARNDESLQAIGSEIDEMLKEAIEKSRGLAHELSPAALHTGDFTGTLGWLAHQIQIKHGLVVHVRADGAVNLRSEIIATLLYRTAQELLFNVVKHARVTEAEVRIRRHGGCVCLLVADRGRGFDPRQLRDVAGYGLLNVRERIEMLGGRMKIRSDIGKGSAIFITVPDHQTVGAAPGAPAHKKDETTETGRLPGEKRRRLRVLLADDHRIVREGLRSLLSEQDDVEIVGEAAQGREAVDLALELDPDVVIMDVSMPLIDGDAATHLIRKRLPLVRVVALSTYDEPEKRDRMLQAGAETYVLRTASSDELLAAVRGKKAEIGEPLLVQD